MIPCICVDDSARPNDLPLSKWVKAGETYHIVYATLVLPQRQLAFELDEIFMDESCFPYKYFLANRFIIKEDDIDTLMELISASKEADVFLDNIIS
jgi:hypothetical protein